MLQWSKKINIKVAYRKKKKKKNNIFKKTRIRSLKIND